MKKLPINSRTFILLGAWVVTMTFFNTNNPLMSYLNAPRNLFMADADWLDYLYLVLFGLILTIWSIGIYWLTNKKVKIQRGKWQFLVLTILIGLIVEIVIQFLMIIFPDFQMLAMPETVLDLQYFDTQYWAIISVVNLGFMVFSWLSMASVNNLIKENKHPRIAKLASIIVYTLSWCLLMNGGFVYQGISHLIVALPLVLYALKHKNYFQMLLCQWIILEVAIYLIYILR